MASLTAIDLQNVYASAAATITCAVNAEIGWEDYRIGGTHSRLKTQGTAFKANLPRPCRDFIAKQPVDNSK